MSTTIDQKVVEMQFDNRQFERGVQTTMSTLDKLKQSLNLTGASKGLEDVSKSAKGVNLSPIASAAETVGLKFNAMYTIADQALRNITNSAMNAGKRIASVLTIDPIKTGLSEYETQINAVQTILANTESKGTTLGQVNAALDELNTYADKTIYNFTEMTRNIGTFTAAGVDLNTSVNAIQGIANLAAVSGSNSQQASTAMYQLSQALSSGTVKLMDWNSVVNAGMGGQVFQDALKETARVHGVAIDDMIEKNGSFRETLSSGWLTADILTETLSHFTMAAEEGSAQWEKYKKSLMDDGYTEEQANAILKLSNTATDAATKVKTATQLWDTLKETAQSGWTQTWEIIMGDFGEAKEVFSGLYETLAPMIEATSTARNELLSGGLSSGWKQLMGMGISDEEGYRDTIQNVAKEHGVAIDEMIKKEGSFDAALKAGLKEGTITSDMLTESVTKMADKMRNMSEEERDAAGYTKEHVEQIEALEAGLKDGSISMDEFAEKIQRPSGRENLIQSLYNALNALISVFKPIKEAFREIFPPTTAEQLYSLTERIRAFTERLKLSDETSDNLKRTFKGLFAILSIVKQVIGAVFTAIKPLFGGVGELSGGILGLTAKFGDWLVSLNESIKASGFLTTAAEKIAKAFEFIKTALRFVIDGVKAFTTAIGTAFAGVSSNATEHLSPLAIIGNAILAVFKGIANVIKKVAPFVVNAVSGIWEVLKNLFSDLFDSVKNADFNKLFDLANGGILAAIGVFIAKFVKSGQGILDGVSGILDNAGGFLEGITNILGGVSEALGAFSQSLRADALKKIAVAIGILALSLWVLSSIDSEAMTIALQAITGLFIELMGALYGFSKINLKGVGKLTGALIGLSTSLLILSIALKIMSTMEMDELVVALIAMAAGLGALVGAVNLLPDKKVKSAAKAIKQMSKAILILAVALKIMGSMTWGELAVGLTAMVAGLGALVGAIRLLPKDTSVKAAGMIVLALAMVVLSGALKIMATMSWDDVARSLVTLAGSLGILAAGMALMKKAIPGALAMLIVAPALIILAGAMKIMATMSWDAVARGLIVLAGSLGIIAIAMALMKKAIFGATALLVISAALAVLAPILKVLGSMSLAEIGKSLLVLAGVFGVFGLAAVILKPVVGTMIKLSAALLILGVACAAIGTGVFLLGVGLTTLAGSGQIVVSFLANLISLIPHFFRQIGEGLVACIEAIAASGVALGKALIDLVKILVQVLVECIPVIADGAMKLIVGLLEALVSYAPQIIDLLVQFLISIIDGLARNIPALVDSIVNFFAELFGAVLDVLSNVDAGALQETFKAIGLIAAVIWLIDKVKSAIPGAIAGVLGIGVVIAELALVLAAIGALAQIPGLKWLVEEGGDFLQAVGTAIGQFVGGLIGGIAAGITSALPQMATDLSTFMTNLQPFIEGAKNIDAATMDGVLSIAKVILALTAAELLEGLTSWLTGGSSIASFGEELASFGPHLKAFADSVSGIDESAIQAAANAGKALADMAATVPNEGGVAGWFAGENSIAKFGEELVTLGTSLMAFSLSVTGLDTEAVYAAANAAKALTEMADTVPNEGGAAAWFAGENSIAKFGEDLVELGKGMKGFSDIIAGISPENITAAAAAGKALAEMADTIPNEGGMVAWFTGDNSIASFAPQLPILGKGMKDFSDALTGVSPENITAAASAGKALAEMADTIPNEGGMVSWFAGDNSVASFASQLAPLGTGLKGFSDAVAGIVPENITAAAVAGQAIADMTNTLPNEGGVAGWFAGENSLATFASNLEPLGKGLKAFSDAVAGVSPENIIAAATAGQALADMTNTLPNEGGVASWFAGDNSLATFAENLEPLGKGLKAFSDAVDGVNPENLTAASSAAKSLAEMTNTLPNEGGVASWFAGDNSLATFANNLEPLGKGLKAFSDSVTGINPENLTAATAAAKSLAEMTNTLPNEGGVASWFAGDNSLATFVDNLEPLGKGLKVFSDSVAGINPENLTAATSAAKSLAEMTNTLPNEGGVASWFAGDNSLATFAKNLKPLGEGMKVFSDSVAGINAENVKAATDAAVALAKMTNTLPNEGGVASWFAGDNSMATFAKNLKPLGTGMKGFSDAVAGIVPENVTAAATAAKDLAKMADTAPSDPEDMVEFGKYLAKFGKKLAEYFTATAAISGMVIANANRAISSVENISKNIDSDGIKQTSESLKQFIHRLHELSELDGSFADGFEAGIKKIADVNIEGLLTRLKDAESKLHTAGQTLVIKLSGGISSKKNDATTAAKKVVNNCTAAIKELTGKFTSAGKDLGAGLVKGINAKQQAVYDAGYALGKKAVQGEKDGQKSNSPSKLTIQAGKWLGEGLVIGMEQMGRNVYRSGYELGSTATKSLSSTISRVADMVNTDIDAQPTIRPVLDLSDVKTGAGLIDGLLNTGSVVGVAANVGAINTMMNRSIQNGVNSDVVSAIDKLRNELGNVGNTSYTINGITYDDGSNITNAVETLIRAARIERRI